MLNSGTSFLNEFLGTTQKFDKSKVDVTYGVLVKIHVPGRRSERYFRFAFRCTFLDVTHGLHAFIDMPAGHLTRETVNSK